MNSTLFDRMIVIWIATALIVWTCCLAVLWGGVFDASGESMLVTLSAILLALSTAILLPTRLVRIGLGVLRWFNF